MASRFRKLQDKHVLIIGGTSGIGFAVAEGALEAGARVTVSSSNPARVDAAVAKLRAAFPQLEAGAVAGYTCDLSKPTVEQDLEALFAQVTSGGDARNLVDHLVFTAGDKMLTGGMADVTYEALARTPQVRYYAAALAAKVATGAGGGYLAPGPFSSITFTTGVVSQKPLPGWAATAGMGAALHGLTRGLALDLAPVRVNLVSPGSVVTELWDSVFGDDPAVRRAQMDKVAASVPTGRLAHPEDCAEAYLWLMKDPSVTGTVVNSDSGHLLV